MSSLKGYTVALARLLGTTPAALYERQRALVRAGMLDLSDGRGPGSGVRTTAGSVALLLIAVLATDSLAETENRTRQIAEAQPQEPDRHPFEGRRTFLSALTFLLTSQFWSTGRPPKIVEITVSRTAARAAIKYHDREGTHAIQFAGPSPAEPAINVSATIDRDVFRSVALDVLSIVAGAVDVQDAHDEQKRRATALRRRGRAPA